MLPLSFSKRLTSFLDDVVVGVAAMLGRDVALVVVGAPSLLPRAVGCAVPSYYMYL